MKKSNIMLMALALSGAALSMTVTSCQDESGFPEPVKNPQLPAMTASDLTVTGTLPQTIDLTALNDGEEHQIELATVVAKNLPSPYTIDLRTQIGREAEFVHTANLVTYTEAVEGVANTYRIYTTADDLEGAYISAIGKSAKTKPAYFRCQAFAVNGTAEVLIGQPTEYVLTENTTITPLDLGIVIEDGYGLLGTINGWSVATAVPFNHSGADVYDDPIFTLTVTISAAQAAEGYWWKVVPQSTIATGNWVDAANASFGTAVNGSDALDGNLVPRTDTEDCGAGCVKTPGVFQLILDMENQTYEFKPLYESYLYIPGDPNGWNHNTASWLGVNEDKAKGFARLNGSFKFTSTPDWNGINYGDSGTAGTLSTDGGAGNLSVSAADMYFISLDLDNLSYSFTPITSLGLIGDFNGWGSQLAMTPNADKTVWTGKLTVTDGQGWKFRMNDNWDINLGGDLTNLTVGGDNIVVPAGTYTVTLNVATLPYTATLTK